ncbi:MAG: hypothetical protein EPN57_20685 [Paraburkholderia sp.]|nr:MAG: hypothetical protein EPN57_20685 [Paraburkholderia sp.]
MILVLDPPPGQMYVFGGILLDSSYNGTRLRWQGYTQLPSNIASPGVTTPKNFGGCWTGIVIGQADEVTLENMMIHGNRLNMADNEHVIPIGVAGATNLRIENGWRVKEVRGDAIYLGQADWQASSSNPQNVTIGDGAVVNSADDGRNAISVVACTTGSIGRLVSIGVGGVVGGATQPGGLDIEPDYGYQSVTDFKVHDLQVTTAGTAGVGVIGKSISGNNASRDWNCYGIEFGSIRVLRTGIADPTLPDPSQTPALGPAPFVNCADVDIAIGHMKYAAGTRGQGVSHDFCQNVRAKWRVSTVSVGVAIGMGDMVLDSDFEVIGNDYSVAVARTSQLVRTDVRTKAYYSVPGSTAFPVQAHSGNRSNISQVNTHYIVEAPYDGNNARAFRNEPNAAVTFGAGTEVRGGDWTGYASPPVTIDAAIPKRHITGLMQGPQNPGLGMWAAGDRFECVPPQYSQTTGKVLSTCIRLTSGGGNTPGVDWVNDYGTNS